MSEAGGRDELLARAQQRVGKILKGKYRLDRVLGVGGMAVVYAATHRNQSHIAVKMLHLELSLSEDVRGRFLREGYVANTVGHPGALVVIDEDVAEDGAAFLVMELLDGQPLDVIAKTNGGILRENVVLAIGDAVLDVLVAAHAKTIVHRDIKPANLFITRDGTLKVLDFGVARLRDASSQDSTRTGAMMGTPAFMSPEQAYGRTHEVDAKSDIWAVGASLFRLLTGRHVHLGEGASEILIKAATVPAVSLASVRPATHPGIAAVVDRALAFDKAARWESAAAMRDAIPRSRARELRGPAVGQGGARRARGGHRRGGDVRRSRPLPGDGSAMDTFPGAVARRGRGGLACDDGAAACHADRGELGRPRHGISNHADVAHPHAQSTGRPSRALRRGLGVRGGGGGDGAAVRDGPCDLPHAPAVDRERATARLLRRFSLGGASPARVIAGRRAPSGAPAVRGSRCRRRARHGGLRGSPHPGDSRRALARSTSDVEGEGRICRTFHPTRCPSSLVHPRPIRPWPRHDQRRRPLPPVARWRIESPCVHFSPCSSSPRWSPRPP